MTPKKSIIERAKGDGTLARVNQLVLLRHEQREMTGEEAL